MPKPNKTFLRQSHNRFRDLGRIGKNIAGGNTDRIDPALFEPRAAAQIANRSVTRVMREPVDLDRQICPRAEKIEYERPGGMLFSKPDSLRRAAQFAPQHRLGQGKLAP